MPCNETAEQRNEVYQAVGRNLLNFQRFEFLLKHLLGRSAVRFEVSDSGMETAFVQRQDAVSDQTLGMLVRQLFEEFLFSRSEPPPDLLPAAPKIGLRDREMASATTITLGDAQHAEWKTRLENLVNDRNRLVHHFWEDFAPDTLDTSEGCERALVHLEEQRNRIRRELEALKVLIDGFYELHMTLKEGLKDPAFRREFFGSANTSRPS